MPETPADEQPPVGSGANDRSVSETQEERALRALQAIYGGGDLTGEAMKLSNEYTDRHTARFTAWVRRVIMRQGS